MRRSREKASPRRPRQFRRRGPRIVTVEFLRSLQAAVVDFQVTHSRPVTVDADHGLPEGRYTRAYGAGQR